eukprot:GHRR01020198.1.p1 GENE.GHRR01020198.1~~GHRR01020198.1.p1  ORF type:complete len:104 (-),score=1.47 GHRR01020198.1:143-454(-)
MRGSNHHSFKVAMYTCSSPSVLVNAVDWSTIAHHLGNNVKRLQYDKHSSNCIGAAQYCTPRSAPAQESGVHYCVDSCSGKFDSIRCRQPNAAGIRTGCAYTKM